MTVLARLMIGEINREKAMNLREEQRMNAVVRKATSSLKSKVIFAVGACCIMGCSQETTSKPQAAAAPPAVVATQREPSKSAPTKTQSSSLEALQRGTLGKGDEEGPLRDVNFNFDRYELSAEARDILKGHATWLKAHPRISVEIEGHCDERGTNDYNLALGAKRADSAKRYLIDLGISPGTLTTTSYGEEIPLCRDQNEACWARNRRAHFVVKAGPTN
jgi:peptidoglycan-associated lipoprotein